MDSSAVAVNCVVLSSFYNLLRPKYKYDPSCAGCEGSIKLSFKLDECLASLAHFLV